MSEYDHSDFFNQPTVDQHLEGLHEEQRLSLIEFYDNYGDPPADKELSADDYRHQFTYKYYAKTSNHIYIAMRHTDMGLISPQPDDYRIATARLQGNQLHTENYDVIDIQSKIPKGGVGMDRIIYTKGIETSRLAVIEMARIAIWIELNENGHAVNHPLSPFNPKSIPRF